MFSNNTNRTVYSTSDGRICPQCGKPVSACVCQKDKGKPSGDGIVRIRLEKKGRKGKSVTLVSGLPLNETQLKDLAGEMKKKCGSGGAVKEAVIELQGDHVSFALTYLKEKGFSPKKAGG